MIENAMDNKSNKRKKVVRMVIGTAMILVIAAFAFLVIMAFSIKGSDSPVGYWVVKEATSNGVVMTPQDAEAMGFNEIGSIRFDKSGSCKVTVLGKEDEGQWVDNENGTLTITYGENQIMTIELNRDGTITAIDESYIEYLLEK